MKSDNDTLVFELQTKLDEANFEKRNIDLVRISTYKWAQELDTEVKRLKNAVEELQEQNSELQSANDELENQLAELLASRTWKLSRTAAAPLQTAKRLAKARLNA